MKRRLVILVFLIFGATQLFAQEKFTATASKTNVKVGEYFVIDFSLNTNGENFKPPSLNKFRILGGPYITRNKMIIGGDTIFKNIFYSYIVSVTKEGIYNIDTAFSVTNGHTMLLSNPLKITVQGRLTPEQISQQYKEQETNRPHWAFDTLDIKNISKEIFIKTEVDKKNVHVGEPIKITYSLYFRVNMSGYKYKIPDFNGFRLEKISNSDNRNKLGTTEYINNKIYNVAILMQQVVFPEHAGGITIAPFVLNTILQGTPKLNSDSPFGDNQPFSYDVKSDPIIIHVMNLSKSKKQ